MKIKMTTFENRQQKTGQFVEIEWEEFKKNLSHTAYTSESHEEFISLSKDEQTEIKDVGGFVLASFTNNTRKKVDLQEVYGIALDADYANQELVDSIELFCDFESVVYSTHKHTKENMRLRWVIPTNRPMTPDESQAVGRLVADQYGLERFDMTTFQPSRLMFNPSTSKGSEYLFFESTGQFLDVDEWLAKYGPDEAWKNQSLWPCGKNEKINPYTAEKLEDPTTKKGIVGAFCRTYTIQDAIAEYLTLVYTPTDNPNRYSYAKATTCGGLVVYEDIWAHSFHESDPISGRSVNAYDLVRIHLFGDDADSNNKMGMMVWEEDNKVRELLRKENQEKNNEKKDLALKEEEKAQNIDWKEQLMMEGKGQNVHVKSCQTNLGIILKNDPNLKNLGGLNELTGVPEKLGALPWDLKKFDPDNCRLSDTDITGLRIYLETTYGLFASDNATQRAVDKVVKDRTFHPVRNYLSGLTWDGVPRIEAMLIDYLGAEDNLYTRTISRKFMCGAVARALKPGCKWDYILVLVGDPGAGKSTFIRLLASDKFYTSSVVAGTTKEAYESLKGYWIGEFEEMTAFQHISQESAKQFISKQTDTYRPAYGHYEIEYKRQIVFMGSTNRYEFLNDHTGNRRYWPVDIKKGNHNKNIFSDLEKERDQLWAEALECYKNGEALYLDDEKIDEMATEEQMKHSLVSVRQDAVEEFLNTKLPENWTDMSTADHIAWLKEADAFKQSGTQQRTKVCLMEIWVECFGGVAKDFSRAKQKEVQEYLEHLGWVKTGTRYHFGEYGRTYAYEKEWI